MKRLARDLVLDASRVSGLGRKVAARSFQEAISIAMYHGLAAAPLSVPEPCILDEPSFRSQMAYLADNFTVVHLEDAARVAATRPARPVACLTFDDGFASVHDLAWPILRQFGLPATVYLVTSLIDSEETVWFATLHHAITHTRAPSVALGDAVHPLTNDAARQSASAHLQRALKLFGIDEFDDLLRDLLEQLQTQRTDFRTVDHFRMLTSRQIEDMAADDLIRFGGHTEHHRILTRVPAAHAQQEVTRSIAATAQLCGRATTSFAYPNGGPDDFDEASVSGLRALGIDNAVTTSSGPNWPWSDRLRLNRYCIGSGDSLGTFAWRMHHVPSRLRTARSALKPGYPATTP